MDVFEQTKMDYIAFKQGYIDNHGASLQSNWPYKDSHEHASKERIRPNIVWFLDSKTTGHTVAKAKNFKELIKLRKIFPNARIRKYHPTVEEIEQDLSDLRQEKRLGLHNNDGNKYMEIK